MGKGMNTTAATHIYNTNRSVGENICTPLDAVSVMTQL